MTERLLVLSDLHIAPPSRLASFHAGPTLAMFLRENARPDTTLVLAGDIVDFLQVENRPPHLDMPGAPALMRATLHAIATTPWGRAVFDALAACLQAGGRVVLLPGNHDPELHHPETRAILLEPGIIGLPHHPGLTLHTSDQPWSTTIAGRTILIGHGHRTDGWNDIDPNGVRRALATGASNVELPPGSRLVLELMNPFKRALDPDTGQPRFPFVDLLKPEMPAVALILLYLDPRLFVSRLDTAFAVGKARLMRRFARLVRLGPVLGDAQPAPRADEDAIADQIVESLIGKTERDAPDASIAMFEALLEGAPPPRANTLAQHGKRRWPIRAWLRSIARDAGSFFDRKALSADDRSIIARYLPEGAAPAVAIFGHTHAARHVVLEGGREYINTGTWMDLMDIPTLATDKDVEAWIDKLDARQIHGSPRPTYAEVTAEGAALRDVPVGP